MGVSILEGNQIKRIATALETIAQGGGGGGGTTDYNDLDNKPQIGGVTLSGNKTLHDLGAAAESDIPDVSGFYTKPQTGIPASDIADGVIPDVSGFYTKPGTGIPSSDMASAVQTSLGKADSAYQKPESGIPATDMASGVIPVLTDLIDDTAGDGDTDKVWSADKTAEEVSSLSEAITNIPPENLQIIDVVHVAGGNLFDKDSATRGKYFNHASPGVLSNDNDMWYEYVALDGAGDYSYKAAPDFYGDWYGKTVVFFDANKEYLSSAQGTYDITDGTILHVTITQTQINSGVAYVGYSVMQNNRSQAMFVKSSTYPSSYIPYMGDKLQLMPEISIPQSTANPLYGKAVVFDGDSICADGASSGWAGRIGENNGMTWHNTGEGGGTITAGLYYAGGSPRHWVSRYIDTIHSTYSTLDYLILEGGTNDADLLSDSDIGTIDYANWTTFDDTNFVGALESLFYKATSYYPSAKIGFIIPQKMGIDSNSGYDSGSSPSCRRRRMFFETAIDVCKKWGIPYIDLWEGSPLCPKLTCYYDSTKTSTQNIEAGKAYMDGQHLTDVGYDIITPKIEAWMKTL